MWFLTNAAKVQLPSLFILDHTGWVDESCSPVTSGGHYPGHPWFNQCDSCMLTSELNNCNDYCRWDYPDNQKL